MELSKETLIEISKAPELSIETKDQILVEHFKINKDQRGHWVGNNYVIESENRINYSEVKDIICNYKSTFGQYTKFDNVDDFCEVIGNSDLDTLYDKDKYTTFQNTAEELIDSHVFTVDEIEKLVICCRKLRKHSLPRIDFVLNCNIENLTDKEIKRLKKLVTERMLIDLFCCYYNPDELNDKLHKKILTGIRLFERIYGKEYILSLSMSDRVVAAYCAYLIANNEPIDNVKSIIIDQVVARNKLKQGTSIKTLCHFMTKEQVEKLLTDMSVEELTSISIMDIIKLAIYDQSTFIHHSV